MRHPARFFVGEEFTTEGTEWEEGQSEGEPKTHPQKTRMGHPAEKRKTKNPKDRGICGHRAQQCCAPTKKKTVVAQMQRGPGWEWTGSLEKE